MDFSEYFPVWDELTQAQRETLTRSVTRRSVPAGTVLHRGEDDCLGVLLVRSGQLRVYISSDEGREVTLYRLFERDLCLLSASCAMPNIQFETTVEAEKDSEIWIIPPAVFRDLRAQSLAVSNFVNDVMSSRFSEVMWRVEQILWKSMDKRVASFLLEESALEGSKELHLTHDRIAAHLGTAREVVTRMLRYFQSEGLVALSRGTVELTDEKRLAALCGE